MIKVEGVSKVFSGKTAVDQLSFEVQEGQNLVLIGTSGCGKTTTLRMINRLTELSSGKITVAGRDIMSVEANVLRRGIGYVLQHHGLFPHYTVEENIAVVPLLLGWDKVRIRTRTEELMEKLHLPAAQYLKAFPSELSGGQQQRVGLARALIADPPVILMDEPFGALDEVTRAGIRKEFTQLEEFRRKTMVMVTHDVNEAFEIGDIICIMDKGKIVQQGNKLDLLFRPANDFVKNFFAGHRLELQLKNTALSELLPLIPQTPENNNMTNDLDEHMNVWAAMEQFFAADDKDETSAEAGVGATKPLTMAMLTNAFKRFTKNKN